MAKINPCFLSLKEDYLFKKINEKTKNFSNLINLGIGDVKLPISKNIIKEICRATLELKNKKTFKGYTNPQGEFFLREAIAKKYYKNIDLDEVFISIGTKNDISVIHEIFSKDASIAIPNPAYPVYLNTNILDGKKNIVQMACLEENNFLPMPGEKSDLFYLCSPHNPTGEAFSYEQLEKWVAYARENNSVILYDGAYEAFISSEKPKSIYEIKGAKDVAIEFRSFSKSVGFTNLRLSYYVIPKTLKIENISLLNLWKKRLDVRFGGVPYPIQKGALISLNDKQALKTISFYKENANLLRNHLKKLKFKVFGGIDSPYIWCQINKDLSSWECFDKLLNMGIVTIPGEGFGACGEGYIRISAFAKRKDILKAIKSFSKYR